MALFRAQVMSRHLDRMLRKLQAQGQRFYTIGSSGHEGNVALALRPIRRFPIIGAGRYKSLVRDRCKGRIRFGICF